MTLLLYFGALSCGDGGGTGPGVASVAITPSSGTVNELDSLQLTATPKDGNGNPLTGRAIAWSTNAGTKASVSQTGLVHAFHPGPITVTAASEGVAGSATVTIVVPVRVVVLAPTADTLNKGDTVRLTATLFGIGADPPTDSTLTWTSSDPLVATVVSGLVSATGGGSTMVTATATSGKNGTAVITVRPPVATVTISPSDTLVYATNFASFVTIVRDAQGDTLTQWQDFCPTGCNVTYPVTLRNLDTTVARFVLCCTVVARKGGVDTIVATSQGVSDSAILRVMPLTFTAVAVGNDGACGLNVDSIAYCWGAGSPRVASAGQRFVHIDYGQHDACGLSAAGVPQCFLDTSSTPVGAPASDSLTVGATFLCGLTTGGEAWCAGGGLSGQLGAGLDTGYSKQAMTVTGGHTFTTISAGGDNACAIATGGAAYCWGSNAGGMLGNGDTVSHSSTPVPVAGNLTFVQISAGYGHVCGVTNSGDGYCWGSNLLGELGSGDTASSRSTPQMVAGGLQFAMVSAGAYHSCGLTTTGAAYCWGLGTVLGRAAGTNSSTPVPVDGGLTFLTVDASLSVDPSLDGSCGRTTDGVYCWGISITGVDGLFQSLTPVKVDGQQ